MKDFEKKNRRRLKERQRSLRMKNLQATEDGVELGGVEYKKSEEDAEHNGRGNFGQATAVAHGSDKLIVKQQAIGKDIETAREAAMSQLAHKAAKDEEQSRVLPALAVGSSANGAPTIVMSLMENGDCEKMFSKLVGGLESSAISPEEYTEAVRYLGREIALGLVQMHSIHMVHRDIKPDNVFLDDKMNVKIGDFGLATWEGDKGAEGAGQGHRYYAAPEERGGDINNNAMKKLPTSPAADIHCLGRTLKRFAARGPQGMPKLEALALQMSAVDPKVRPTAVEVAKHQALAGADGVAKKVLEKVKGLQGADVALRNEPRIIKALKRFDPETGKELGNPYDRSPRRLQDNGQNSSGYLRSPAAKKDDLASGYLRSPAPKDDLASGYIRSPAAKKDSLASGYIRSPAPKAESDGGYIRSPAEKKGDDNGYIRSPLDEGELAHGGYIRSPLDEDEDKAAPQLVDIAHAESAPSPRPKLKRRAGVWNLLG